MNAESSQFLLRLTEAEYDEATELEFEALEVRSQARKAEARCPGIGQRCVR